MMSKLIYAMASAFFCVVSNAQPVSQPLCERFVLEANKHFDSVEPQSLPAFAAIEALLQSGGDRRGLMHVIEQPSPQLRCEMAHVYTIESGRVLEIFEWKNNQWQLQSSGAVSDITAGAYEIKQLKRQNFFNGKPVLKIKSYQARYGAGWGVSSKSTDYFTQKGKEVFLLVPGNGIGESHFPAGEGCFESSQFDQTLRVIGRDQWPDIQVVSRESTSLECATKKGTEKTGKKSNTSIQTWRFDSKQYQVKKQ
jgi:hypothetical protein